jgi:subtilase family serine protease
MEVSVHAYFVALPMDKSKGETVKVKNLVRFIAVVATIVLGFAQAYAQRIEKNVPAGIQTSKDLGRVDASTAINITVHLKLNDKAAFDRAVDALYDPNSPTYHHWMTNDDLRQFAPSKARAEIVRQELEKHGLTILSTDALGFTIRARGSVANMESAFQTELHNFNYNGRIYRANVRNARLSGEAGNYVETVAGLESHQVRPMAVRAVNPRTNEALPSISLTGLAADSGFPSGSTTDCLAAPETITLGTSQPIATYTGSVYQADGENELVCTYLPYQLQIAYGMPDVYTSGYNGAGQSIALVEGYGYPTLEKDANEFAKLAGLPKFNSSNFSFVYPEGKPNPELGIVSGWNIEIALDIDTAHTIAPGASIVEVITNGQDNEDFQASIQYIAENSLANSVSNSYEEDLDLLAGPLEQTSWDDVLEMATAKGISVNFSSGDGGDNGLGTPIGAPGVPSVAPHATAVGGTSVLNDFVHPGQLITTSWGDTWAFLELAGSVQDPPYEYGLYGGGGGGESVFWPKPSWESAIPGKGRQVPDVSAVADPYTGVPIVITVDGAPQVQYGWGGTSLSCPLFSAIWAIANEAAGAPLGQAAPLIASLPNSVQDVLPKSDASPDNVTGTIQDSTGTHTYSASQIFSGPPDLLYGNKQFTSTIWEVDSADFVDFGFGIDSSLTVKKGWDNATGWGTPLGLNFINTITSGSGD